MINLVSQEDGAVGVAAGLFSKGYSAFGFDGMCAVLQVGIEFAVVDEAGL